MKRTKIVAAVAFALAGGALGLATLVQAADKAPTISADLAKPLKAAQDAIKAKKYDDAVADLKIAQAEKGKKSDYDNFVINEMLGMAYYQQQKFTDAAPAMHDAALSQYAPADLTKQWLTAIMGIYYQGKDYPNTISTGQELIKRGAGDSSIYTTIALAETAQGNTKQAAQTIQQIIDKQPKPEEKLLAFQWNSYLKANDPTDADKVVLQLVKYYPKPDYWMNALSPLLNLQTQDAHLQHWMSSG